MTLACGRQLDNDVVGPPRWSNHERLVGRHSRALEHEWCTKPCFGTTRLERVHKRDSSRLTKPWEGRMVRKRPWKAEKNPTMSCWAVVVEERCRPERLKKHEKSFQWWNTYFKQPFQGIEDVAERMKTRRILSNHIDQHRLDVFLRLTLRSIRQFPVSTVDKEIPIFCAVRSPGALPRHFGSRYLFWLGKT